MGLKNVLLVAFLCITLLSLRVQAICQSTDTAVFKPAYSSPPSIPKPDGIFAKNDRLDKVVLFKNEKLKGPEAITIVGSQMYTGTREGLVLEINIETQAIREVGATGGVPLGIKKHPNGQLIIADAKKGLLMMDPDTGISKVLTRGYEGIDFCVLDDLVIRQDGLIVFSVATTKWQLKDFEFDALENRPTGMLVSYDLKAARGHEVKVLVKDLFFANGLSLCPDEACLFFAETTAYRVRKYNFSTGKVDTYAENLPGFPDNIFCNKSMQCWIALVGQREFAAGWSLLDFLHRHPKVIAFLYSLFKKGWLSREKLVEQKPAALLVKTGPKGNVIDFYQDKDVSHVHSLTSVVEYQNTLYLGTYVNNWIGVLKL